MRSWRVWRGFWLANRELFGVLISWNMKKSRRMTTFFGPCLPHVKNYFLVQDNLRKTCLVAQFKEVTTDQKFPYEASWVLTHDDLNADSTSNNSPKNHALKAQLIQEITTSNLHLTSQLSSSALMILLCVLPRQLALAQPALLLIPLEPHRENKSINIAATQTLSPPIKTSRRHVKTHSN